MSFALAHPGLVRGLVIVNSFPWVRDRAKLLLAPLALRALPWGAMPLVRRFTEHRLHSPHARAEDLAEFHARAKRIGRAGYIRRLEILRRYDLRGRLREIQAPTLFLAGDRDRLVPSVRWARYMAERVPDATVRILEGYGHVCLINHDLDLLDHVGPWWEARG
jgi:pimeloyl-ACP methyl ester carboxylesterase